MTPIQDFYKDQTILITGGTGFIGKLALEKLLRSCEPKKIILLVRPKRGKTQKQRFEEIFENMCFDNLKKIGVNFADRVELLCGDCGAPMLGLSEADIGYLQREVTCVIHAAANVRFDQGMRLMIYINVRSVRDLLKIAKDMQQLRAFVYVSTAFSNCPRKEIEERFYEPPMDSEKILSLAHDLDDDLFDVITPTLLKEWPNTYCYTKAIAEDVVRRDEFVRNKIISRPGIVISAYKEPIPGWNDNLHGIVGLIIGVALGVFRSLNIDLTHTSNVIPADYVVNNILASAWNSERTNAKTGQVEIYNFAGTKENRITWGGLFDVMMRLSWVYPTYLMVWYNTYTVSVNTTYHRICVFFMHTIFAHIADGLLWCFGRKPIAVEKYKKIDKLMEVLSYFSLGEWEFCDKNVQKLWKEMSEEDRNIFCFDMNTVEWNTFLEECVVGGRVFLLKDPLETVGKARKKMFLLGVLHYSIVAFLYYILYKFLMVFLNIFI